MPGVWDSIFYHLEAFFTSRESGRLLTSFLLEKCVFSTDWSRSLCLLSYIGLLYANYLAVEVSLRTFIRCSSSDWWKAVRKYPYMRKGMNILKSIPRNYQLQTHKVSPHQKWRWQFCIDMHPLFLLPALLSTSSVLHKCLESEWKYRT